MIKGGTLPLNKKDSHFSINRSKVGSSSNKGINNCVKGLRGDSVTKTNRNSKITKFQNIAKGISGSKPLANLPNKFSFGSLVSDLKPPNNLEKFPEEKEKVFPREDNARAFLRSNTVCGSDIGGIVQNLTKDEKYNNRILGMKNFVKSKKVSFLCITCRLFRRNCRSLSLK